MEASGKFLSPFVLLPRVIKSMSFRIDFFFCMLEFLLTTWKKKNNNFKRYFSINEIRVHSITLGHHRMLTHSASPSDIYMSQCLGGIVYDNMLCLFRSLMTLIHTSHLRSSSHWLISGNNKQVGTGSKEVNKCKWGVRAYTSGGGKTGGLRQEVGMRAEGSDRK